MDKKPTEKPKNQASPTTTGGEQAQRHKQATNPERFGATEKEVLPTTPPMAESDQLPGERVDKSAADDEIDPNEELTPG